MIFPFILGFAALTLLLCHSWYGPDIFYHLTWGRGLIEHAQIWPLQQTLLSQPVNANVYWLFQGLMYLGFQTGGIYLVSGLFLLLWLGIAGLWLRLSGAFRQPWLGAWLFLAFIVCCQLRFEHRPEIFSYLFILLFLLWFERAHRAPPSWPAFVGLFALQVLWTNMHGYFALGVLIAAAALTASLVQRERRMADVKVAAWAGLVVLVASFVSPAGAGAWQAVIDNAQVAMGLRDLNAELFAPSLWPPLWPMPVFWVIWLSLAWSSGCALWQRRNIFAALLALGGLVLSAQAARNIPLLFLLGTPVMKTWPIYQWPRASLSRWAAGAAALTLAVVTVNGWYQRLTGSLGTFGVHLERASYPIGAVDFLKERSFKGKIFTDSYDGGYVEFHLPEVQVAGDSYFSDPDLTRAYFAAIREPESLLRLHQRLAFAALLINVENLLVLDSLLSNREWSLVYTDSHRALFFNRGWYAGPALQLPDSTYYQGDNLRNWSSAFGPISWASVARKHQDRALLRKIVQDVQGADAIPSTLIKMVLAFASDHSDRELAQAVQPLRVKMYESAPGDRQAIQLLDEKLVRCCR